MKHKRDLKSDSVSFKLPLDLVAAIDAYVENMMKVDHDLQDVSYKST